MSGHLSAIAWAVLDKPEGVARISDGLMICTASVFRAGAVLRTDDEAEPNHCHLSWQANKQPLNQPILASPILVENNWAYRRRCINCTLLSPAKYHERTQSAKASPCTPLRPAHRPSAPAAACNPGRAHASFVRCSNDYSALGIPPSPAPACTAAPSHHSPPPSAAICCLSSAAPSSSAARSARACLICV